MQYDNFLENFQKHCKLGEGSSGIVYLCSPKNSSKDNQPDCSNNQNCSNGLNAQSTENNTSKKVAKSTQYFALKKLKQFPNKNPYEESKPFIVEELREVKIMRKLNHANILPFTSILQADKGYKKNYYLALPLGIEILEFAKQKEIQLSRVHMKAVIRQIVEGLAYLHKESVLHRDVKPDNIFLMEDGTVKIGDFSLSRESLPENLSSLSTEELQKCKLTGNVVTRYYRAPEVMYGCRHYGKEIDVWALGCTVAELILHQPIFPGHTDIVMLELIFSTVGFPQQHWPDAANLPFYFEFDNSVKEKGLENLLPDIQQDLLDFIKCCLKLNPKKRSSAEQLLKHQYLSGEGEEDQKEALQSLSKIAHYLHQKKLSKIVV